MTYPQKIVLHSKTGTNNSLENLVEQFLVDGVRFIAVIGVNCACIENMIDEIIIGDGSRGNRFILTSSHPEDSIEDVMELARMINEGQGEPQLVEI